MNAQHSPVPLRSREVPAEKMLLNFLTHFLRNSLVQATFPHMCVDVCLQHLVQFRLPITTAITAAAAADRDVFGKVAGMKAVKWNDEITIG